ncbi:hypothetical protein F0562_023435 [Nyssa sinensis]|uniref:Uncharacterized protein n=1 Tax=Nyssa sinensis TaxID=561372 RepID=A0A5J5BI49_9ASTE|nr:hypothetical protein F0562_023435 [Nyssa sinensis]
MFAQGEENPRVTVSNSTELMRSGESDESNSDEALHIIIALGEIRYESHDLEAQLQLQLMSSTEATNKFKELKKRIEEIDMELRTSLSLTVELRGQLAESSNIVSTQDSETHSLGNEAGDLKRQISDLKSKMSIVETAASEAKVRHCSEIEAAKKMAKAYLEIDTEVLNHLEVSDIESEDYEDNGVFEDPAAPTDP